MIYWLTTSIIAAMLALSAGSYLLHDPTIAGVRDLGFPDFLRIQLAILKLLAIPVLLAPAVPIYLKEWAYAGVVFFLITAIVAHFAHDDPLLLNLLNVVLLAVLAVSYLHLPR